ncbi:MAG: hypothetical protein MZV63_11630 [Marinilabiliales bacterium]|nr:hypothetical protein [Marinilabiliales bacterium]
MPSPADSTLITGASEERRRFVQQADQQYDPAYLEAQMRYNKALLPEDMVLRENGPDAGGMLEIYDQQMDRRARVIYEARRKAAKPPAALFFLL